MDEGRLDGAGPSGRATTAGLSAESALQELDGISLPCDDVLEEVLGGLALGVIGIGVYGRDHGVERLALYVIAVDADHLPAAFEEPIIPGLARAGLGARARRTIPATVSGYITTDILADSARGPDWGGRAHVAIDCLIQPRRACSCGERFDRNRVTQVLTATSTG